MSELIKKIKELKNKLAGDVVILGHHYQRHEIVALSDFVGDSYYLAKISAEQERAKYIVFCGVRFMAEAAAILRSADQKVLHPEKDAGCPLADMADLDEVGSAWEEMSKVLGTSQVTPITYINSSAELKAFCGRNGGVVCTSSNAQRAFDWGFRKAEKLFFFPDQHLGRNTAILKGIDEGETILWKGGEALGGNSEQDIRKARVILWDGFCHVHTFFSVDDIVSVRKQFPEVKVVVHPECTIEVVGASDAAGSTSFIVDYVKKAAKGSIIAVGTEINLVSRIARENPDKKVLELKRSLCPNMFKISLESLLYVLENIYNFEDVKVEEPIRSQARVALDRMLEV